MVLRQSIWISHTLGHLPPLSGGGATSDTAEKLYGGNPETDVDVVGGAREERGTPPLAERRDSTRCPTPAEAVEAVMEEA